MILASGDLSTRGLDGWALGWADSVRFAELDPLGHVNNVAYLSWYEALRARHLMHCGLTAFRPEDPQFVVVALDATYKAEMKLHDDYVVTTRCGKLGNTSFTMEYACFRGEAEMAGGTATVVMVRGGRPERLNEEQRAALGGATG
ncbi:acyl-CoA thioester hydrolase [Hasllibacter halocynthiae]|uniref:Acyl-CoA thioester hydrolase n=1 Tax=Hasllibacter halocynthiae TaxID=595589 RepID=A0A2T0X8G6_9RHOB|nr:thioesterase family protein [Hasllibacter halocynthiae]PRY95219.1 acyl-CoA thioester hydrolase [Hasllibacter halocynthiae]